MKNQVNRGNECYILGCNGRARIKGLCTLCYQRDKVKRKQLLKRLAT
jgi:hypothetical protein